MRFKFAKHARSFTFFLVMLLALPVWSITRNISGIVIGEKGEPLIGAQVREVVTEGQSPNGVITDVEGRFTLKVDTKTTAIEVSYIGYKTQSVQLNSTADYRIVMVTEDALLAEVVVTGYQTISKERTTGSFAKIDRTQMETKRFSSISSLLEGEVAGYYNGQIRGTTTFQGNTTPLYVVDGFPIENTRMNSQGSLVEYLPDINVDDIESITVLKDAAATSIYGARAANGVIVITTKRAGRTQKPEVSVSASLTWTPYKYYTENLADAGLIVELEREWAANNPNLVGDGAAAYAQNMIDNKIYTDQGILAILNHYAGHISENEMNNTLNELSGAGYRFYDQVAKYAKRDRLDQQYNVMVRSGSDINQFKASVTYIYDRLNDPLANYQSLGADLFNSTKLAKWLTFDIGTYVSYSGDKSQPYSPLSPGYTVLPYDRIVNDDGSYFTKTMEDRFTADKMAIYNKYDLMNEDITPMEEMYREHGKTTSLNIRSVARLKIDFTPWLNYTVSFQYERGQDRYQYLYDETSNYVKSTVNYYTSEVDGDPTNLKQNVPYGNIASFRDQYFNAYDFRQQLNFDKTFKEKHNVTAILGWETRNTKIEQKGTTVYNYDTDMLTSTALDYDSMAAGIQTLFGTATLGNPNSFYENVNRYVSIYGNAAYTLNERYNLTGSIRWDRSNLWGTSSKYQRRPAWSVGAAWTMSKESFMEDAEWLNYLRFRFTEGLGGNVSKNSAPYMVASYGYDQEAGVDYGYVATRPNPNLRWERTRTMNIGVDFGMFKNRLSGSIEYYDKKSYDLLAEVNGVPTEGTGYASPSMNNGSMFNRGVEITLDGTIVQKRDWRLTLGATFAYNKNRVTHADADAPMYVIQLDYGSAYPQVGKDYNTLYGYRWAGLSSEGLPQIYNAQGEIVSMLPSDMESIVSLGTTVPKYTGSFNLSLGYKDLSISTQLTYAGGHVMRNWNEAFLGCTYTAIGYITNIPGASSQLANRWKEPGDELKTDIPRVIFAESGYSTSTLQEVYHYSSANILKAGYIQMTNLALTYRIPSDFCKKCNLQGCRIQANIDNPWLWAHTKQAKYQLGGYNAPSYTLGLFVDF